MYLEQLAMIALAAVGCSAFARWFIRKLPSYAAYRDLLRGKSAYQQEAIKEAFKAQQKFVTDLTALNFLVYGTGIATEIAGYSIPVKSDSYVCFYIVMTLSVWSLLAVGPHVVKTIFR